MTVQAPLSPTLTRPAAHTEIGDLERLVKQRYGLAARAERLSAERDEIFRLRDTEQREYAVKVSHGQEESGAIEFETLALLHACASNSRLPMPRVIPTLDGRHIIQGLPGGAATSSIRLFVWLDGVPLSAAPRSLKQTATLGALLAELGKALSDFEHPRQNRHMDGDLQHAARLTPLVSELADASRRRLAQLGLAGFTDNVLPVLPRLRRQVIYNDLNPHNVLVDAGESDRVTGIIDFGDIAHTALINDVAIGASYLTVLGSTALEYPLHFVAAYNEVTALKVQELEVLYDLMMARLVTSVAITEWRASRNPGNRAYILKNTALAWAGLERLARIERRAATAQFIGACNTPRQVTS